MHRVWNNKWWIALTAIGIFAYGAINWSTGEAIDFYQFWLAGQLIERHDLIDIYNPSSRIQNEKEALALADASGSMHLKACAHHPKRSSLELAGTPFLYTFFSWISSGDFDRDYTRYRLLSLAVYLGGLVYLALVLSLPAWGGCLILILFTGFFWAFNLDIYYANITQIQFGLFVFSLGLSSQAGRYRILLGGALMAGLVFLKPVAAFPLACLIMLWILTREWVRLIRFCAGFVIGAVLCLNSSFLLFKSIFAWTHWFQASRDIIMSERYIRRSFLYSVFGLTENYAYTLAAVLALLGFGIICRFCLNRDLAARQLRLNLLAGSLALNLSILTSPLVHGFYSLMLALPWTVVALDLGAPPVPKGNSFIFSIFMLSSILILGQGILFKIGWASSIHQSGFLYFGIVLMTILAAQRMAIKNPQVNR
jgi:hypothetical protein